MPDYDKLAQQYGGTAEGDPYDDIAKKYEGVSSSLKPIPINEKVGISDFPIFSGFAETALPSTNIEDYWKGPAFAIQHPVESAKILGSSMYGAHKEMFQKAGQKLEEAYKTPNLSDKLLAATQAGGYGLAGAIPAIGPAAATTAENLTAEPERGVGNVLGLAAPFGVGKLASKVRPIKPTGDVPMLRSERVGSAPSRIFEGILERSIPGSGPFSKFREKQQKALIDVSAKKVVDTISNFQGSAEELGNLAVKESKLAEEAWKAEAGDLYAEADRIVAAKTVRTPITKTVPTSIVDTSGTPLSYDKTVLRKAEVSAVQPSTRSLKKFAIPLLRRINQEEKLIPAAELQRTKNILESIINSPKQLSFTAFQDARSSLLGIARSYGDPIPGKAGGVASKLAGVTDDAMMEAARASGNPELVKIIRQANEKWTNIVDTFNESLVTNMVKTAPEKAHVLLRSGDLDGIRRIRKVVSPETFQAMKAQVIKDILVDSIQNELAPTFLPESVQRPLGVAPSQQRVLKGTRFREQLEKMGQARISEIFGKTEASELFKLADTAERISPGRGNWISGAINGILLYSLAREAPTMMGFGAEGAAVDLKLPVMLGGTVYGLSKLLTKPEGIVTLRKFVHSMGHPTAAPSVFWANRLAQMVNKEAEKVPMTVESGQPGLQPLPQPPPSLSPR